MTLRLQWIACCVLSIAYLGGASVCQLSAADPGAVEASAESFVKAFNDAKPEAIASLFLPEGELVDEEGNLYQGSAEIKEVFASYFAKYPGATLGLSIESIRFVSGELAIEEGTRFVSTKDNTTGQVRYVAVRAKKNDQWLLASIREFYDQPAIAPGERLGSLAWLEGDWISEDADSVVKISYRWTEDRNFLLGDFSVTTGGEITMKTTQRIGWDPKTNNVRSWLFDSDGGFAEGIWSQIDDSWVIKSTATLPDATTGTATVQLTQKGGDQFTMIGTDRIANGGRLDDFDVTVTRAPPKPSSATSINK